LFKASSKASGAVGVKSFQLVKCSR